MTLAAPLVAVLQGFLIDAARRFGAPATVLTRAASLDYVLMVASERSGELGDDDAAVVRGVRGTLAEASVSALDFIDVMLEARDEAYAAFAKSHIRPGGIFDALSSLAACGALTDGDVRFRIVTLGDDVLRRRAR